MVGVPDLGASSKGQQLVKLALLLWGLLKVLCGVLG